MNSEETTLIKESTSTLCFILFFSDNAAGATEMGLGEQKHMLFLLLDIQTCSPSSNRVSDWEELHPQAGLSCKLFPYSMMLQMSVQLF